MTVTDQFLFFFPVLLFSLLDSTPETENTLKKKKKAQFTDFNFYSVMCEEQVEKK